jgi:predicted MFS family arabinose efflux permease
MICWCLFVAAFVHHLFVIATSINFTAPLLLGILLDAYGPRVCSALSVGLVTAGFLLFSMSSEQFPAFLPAITLIAFGGPGVQSSIIHLSNLYPNQKATVTSIITG